MRQRLEPQKSVQTESATTDESTTEGMVNSREDNVSFSVHLITILYIKNIINFTWVIP